VAAAPGRVPPHRAVPPRRVHPPAPCGCRRSPRPELPPVCPPPTPVPRSRAGVIVFRSLERAGGRTPAVTSLLLGSCLPHRDAGRAPEPPGGHLRPDKLEVCQEGVRAVYTGHAKAVREHDDHDPADRLHVFFTPTNDVQRIVAAGRGNVYAIDGDREAWGDEGRVRQRHRACSPCAGSRGGKAGRARSRERIVTFVHRHRSPGRHQGAHPG